MPTSQSLPAATAAALAVEELQQIILIAKLTPQVIIDQGGGSFTSNFPPSGKKVKSKVFAAGMRATDAHAEVFKEAGIQMLAYDNTIADFSHVAAEHYPLIARWFVTYWLLAGCFTKVPTLVRQTGKIRAKLHTPGNEELLTAWNKAMKDALGALRLHYVDYALLSNEEEARLEGECFLGHPSNQRYFKENKLPLPNIVGAGIGSSSTQCYARGGNGEVVVFADSFLGSKPTAGEEAPLEFFKTRFLELFGKLEGRGMSLQGASFFALNSVGYIAAKIAGELVALGRPAFKVAVVTGMPVVVDFYLKEVRTLPPSRDVNLMLGMLKACKEVGIANVVMEKKGSLSKEGGPLGIEVSWTAALAKKHFEESGHDTSSVGGGADATAE